MTLSRFAALQWLWFSTVARVLLGLPLAAPYHTKEAYLASGVYFKP